jgi:hypothetical protein
LVIIWATVVVRGSSASAVTWDKWFSTILAVMIRRLCSP